MNRYAVINLAAIATLFILGACKKDTIKPEPESPAPIYNVPSTYDFANVNYTSSNQQIDMLSELTTHLRSTHTATAATQPTISAQKLKDMYTNVNSAFATSSLNTSGIQLKEKTGDAFSFRIALEANFDDAQIASVIAAANPTITSASNGIKGKLISPARAILVDANGFEYKEYAEKGVMGAVFYYQLTRILSSISSIDNTQAANGTTAQERAWDEAFGYFGVPVSFPTNTVGLKFWGNYCNSVDVAIGSNKLIMIAFLKGRAAISNKDNSARDAAADIVIKTLEKVGAAKCISYLKSAKNNLSDKATLHHNLSEAFGFIASFKYNPLKTISDADISVMLGYLGSNLYSLNTGNITLMISKLETVFSLNAAAIP
jgi:hypothetical protein